MDTVAFPEIFRFRRKSSGFFSTMQLKSKTFFQRMKVPRISGFEAMKAFGRIGYRISRQTGSHVMLEKEGSPPLTIPDHRELKTGTLRAIIKSAQMTVEEFLRLL